MFRYYWSNNLRSLTYRKRIANEAAYVIPAEPQRAQTLLPVKRRYPTAIAVDAPENRCSPPRQAPLKPTADSMATTSFPCGQLVFRAADSNGTPALYRCAITPACLVIANSEFRRYCPQHRPHIERRAFPHLVLLSRSTHRRHNRHEERRSAPPRQHHPPQRPNGRIPAC